MMTFDQDGFTALEALLQEAKNGAITGTRANPVMRVTKLTPQQLRTKLAVVKTKLTNMEARMDRVAAPRKPVAPKPLAKPVTRRYRTKKVIAQEQAAKQAHRNFCAAMRQNSPTAALVRPIDASEIPDGGPEAFCFYKGLAQLATAGAAPLTNFRTEYTSSPTDGMYDREDIKVTALIPTAPSLESSDLATRVTFHIDASDRAASAKFFVSTCGLFALFRQ